MLFVTFINMIIQIPFIKIAKPAYRVFEPLTFMYNWPHMADDNYVVIFIVLENYCIYSKYKDILLLPKMNKSAGLPVDVYNTQKCSKQSRS